MGSEIKKNLLSILVGYFRHLFLSQSIFIGLFFVFLPIIYISNEFTNFSQVVGELIVVYANFFSIDSASRFFATTIGLMCMVLPLISYLLLKIFRAATQNKAIPLKVAVLAIFYFLLVLVNTIIIWLFDKNFNILVFFALLFIELLGVCEYLVSLLLDYINNRIQFQNGVAPTIKN